MAAAADPRPLRVAAVVDDLHPPAWAARALRELAGRDPSAHAPGSDPATPTGSDPAPRLPVVLVVVAVRRTAAAVPPRPRWLRAYDVVDARVAARTADPLTPTDVRALLEGVTIIELDATLHQLAGFDLDAIVDLGTAGQPAGLVAAARLGVWTLVCGERHPGVPPATWEVIARVPLTRAQLIADLPGGGRRVLYESSSATDPTSARRNRAQAYAKAAAFVRRTLRDLAAADPAALPGTTSAPPGATNAVPIGPASQPVTPLRLTRFAGSVLRDRLQRAAWRKQWILAYGIDPTGPAGSDEPARDLARLARIVPPADRFWADPFVVRHGDGWVILLEERIFARPHAHISALPVARDGTLGDVVPVLERDYHLSYPFVFAWNGAHWMIPESAHNRTVELWRATDFPRRWTLERVLLTGLEAADATLIEHAGAWWMFCTVAEPGASKDDELHVFHAPSPLGPWRPHPRNPVKSTARGARPAGRPFRAGGSWVRPAQDGSRGYGGALMLWRIDQLDEATYRETELRHVAPDWDPALVGLHTINAAAGLTVIDLRILRPRWLRSTATR